MRRTGVVLLAALATAVAMAAVPSVAQEGDEEPVIELGSSEPVERGEYDSYVVLMKADPLAVTEGKENLRSTRARNRGQQLKSDHERVLREASVPAETKVSDYLYVLNGFAANITHAEAERLQAHEDVAVVLPDELLQPHTDASPDFLSLTDPIGAWRTGLTGAGVVVGVIDTGIWPEHPSFAADGLPPPPISPLEDVVVDGPAGPYEIGTCEFGNAVHNPADEEFACNNKLVGARQVLPMYRQQIGAEDFEFDSARDDNGHGTHTASTAAGNRGVADVEILGSELDVDSVSGIAPDAHIIAYKGLGHLGGFGSDLALAIDIAVFDGVDVINYSIGGTATTITVDELAFLFAAEAGVHVATSAGNTGPDAATIRNPAKVPWLTTVGATTQPRFLAGTVVLGDGREFEGASVTLGTDGAFPLVDAADHGGDLCLPGTLDAGVEGAVVLCRRGETARVAKSFAVHRAGGVGMVMYENTDDDSLFTDTHWVPSVSVDNTPGVEIKAYISAEGQDATAEITNTQAISEWPSAPSLTRFSSRGPNVFDDVIKPDITGPGLQILAGGSPFAFSPGVSDADAELVQGELFQAIGGTSMASPHAAGMFALLAQANPDWTPAMARSGMMTTADQDVVDNDRVSPATPFGTGSGRLNPGAAVRPGSAFQPGLVYDAGVLDYFGFLCDVFPEVFADPAGTCSDLEADGIPTDARDLNYPSIAIPDLPGTQTVTRTVTSVARETGNRRYTASVEAPPGYSVEVSPSSFTIRTGQTQTFEVTITNESAPRGQWEFGSLTWTDQTNTYQVHSPIAVNTPRVNQLWEARYDGPGSRIDGTWAVGVSPDGARVFVTGQSLGQGTLNDYATVAYDAATGEELWIARYDGPVSRPDIARGLGVSPDGARVFVTGQSEGQGTSNDYATVAYDAATGEELWVARYDGPASGSDRVTSLGVGPDGERVFVAGQSPGEGTSNDYASVAYDAATGEELWVARYDGPVSGSDVAQALSVSPDSSRLFVTGNSTGEGTSGDYTTVAYNTATGDESWVARYDGPASGLDIAWAVAANPDGTSVYVTGQSVSEGTSGDYATLAYDAGTGEEQWSARYDGPGNSGDVARAVGVSPDGARVFVTGNSQGVGTGNDYSTVAYDTADGGEVWVARYNGPANGSDAANALAVSADGARVFVTGQSGGTGNDYATVAFDMTDGGEVWVARYNGPANGADVARALAVSPDGERVFVTGNSQGVETFNDYATVAYEELG